MMKNTQEFNLKLFDLFQWIHVFLKSLRLMGTLKSGWPERGRKWGFLVGNGRL